MGAIACRLGVIGAVAHPDLMYPDMRPLGHITRLARQQQEHAHRFTISFGRDDRAIALRGRGLDTGADGRQRTKIPPAPSKRNRVVDRTATGIQHDGHTAELTSAREIIEILGTVGGNNADRADPARAIRLPRDPATLHRHFAFFERDAGMCRAAERGDRARQCDAKAGGADQRPTANIKRPYEPQVGSFPQALTTSSGNGPGSTPDDSVIPALSKK